MFKKLLSFINRPTKAGEIMRFVIVGALATMVDFLIMGVTMYIIEPSEYPDFFSVFFGARSTPSLLAKLLGTGTGFLFGLVANYLFSVLFVFNEKGRSKTVKGFLLFAVFSVIGLLIHEIGMYIFSDQLLINEWITKIILTLVVLVYNYLSRKAFIFKSTKKEQTDEDQSDNSLL